MGSAGLLFAIVLASGVMAGSPALAVYALSYWHYLLYWWAYRYGMVAGERFRRDAIAMKSVALLALAYAYLGAPAHPLSLSVVAAGFLLNATAARALGPLRTYYGWELGDVPHVRVTAFPYSVVRHPMLVGNILAYGGTLLNPQFRKHWWALATGHIALNVALLVMEARVTPLRCRYAGSISPDRPAGARWLAGGTLLAATMAGAAGAAAAHATGWTAGRLPCAAVAASAALYVVTSAGWYVWPRTCLHFYSDSATEIS